MVPPSAPRVLPKLAFLAVALLGWFGCSSRNFPITPKEDAGPASGRFDLDSGSARDASAHADGYAALGGDASAELDASAECGNPLDLAGCPCTPGSAPRDCYSGPARQAGSGSCTMGSQGCVGQGELGGTWGACTGSGAPTTCAATRATCGMLSDDCGGVLDCGTCAGGLTCSANVCAPAACVPVTCASLGDDCGSVPDGCGGTLDCGTCGAGQQCGSAGVPNQCGACAAVCVPGAIAWCDANGTFACGWGQEQCTPQGEWGPCVETASGPPNTTAACEMQGNGAGTVTNGVVCCCTFDLCCDEAWLGLVGPCGPLVCGGIDLDPDPDAADSTYMTWADFLVHQGVATCSDL
jgi:hypothetical protein